MRKDGMMNKQAKYKNGETNTDEVQVGNNYPGLCCAGYNWEVAIIFFNDNPAYNSIWGTCSNLACTGRDGNGTDHYQGVSSWLQEDFEERLLARPGDK